MSKPKYLKTWGYVDIPCGVCGSEGKENESVHMSDGSLKAVVCPKHLMALKLRLKDEQTKPARDCGKLEPDRVDS